MLKTLILSTICLTLAFAGEAETKLPASAQQVLDKATKDVAAERAKYDMAASKVLDGTEKALRAEMDKLTKAGKLEDAMAVKKVLEGLRESVVASVDEKAKQKGDLLGDTSNNVKVTSKSLVGVWQLNNKTVIEFTKTGAILVWWSGTNYDAGKPHEATGSWSCDAKTAGYDLCGKHFSIGTGSGTEYSVTDPVGVPDLLIKITPRK